LNRNLAKTTTQITSSNQRRRASAWRDGQAPSPQTAKHTTQLETTRLYANRNNQGYWGVFNSFLV